MMLEFNVRNQEINRIDNFSPVEKSVGYLVAKFNFKTEDWTDAVKIAVFKNLKTGKELDRSLEEDVCIVPSEALSDNGQFEVSVYGIKDGQKITSSVVVCNLNRTLSGGSMTEDDTLSAAEKLLLETQNKVSKTGHEPNKFLGTDEKGNVVAKDPTGDVSDEQVAEAVEEYLTKNPPTAEDEIFYINVDSSMTLTTELHGQILEEYQKGKTLILHDTNNNVYAPLCDIEKPSSVAPINVWNFYFGAVIVDGKIKIYNVPAYQGSRKVTVKEFAIPTKTSQLTNDSGFLTELVIEHDGKGNVTVKNAKVVDTSISGDFDGGDVDWG